MTIRPILRLGDPRLRQVAAPVNDLGDPALAQLLIDLADTMAAHHGAGLAAPQIGVPLRVVLFGSGQINPRYPEAAPIPPTTLINPELTPLGSEQQEGWEGCGTYQESCPLGVLKLNTVLKGTPLCGLMSARIGPRYHLDMNL
jgi:peptide deformylase